MPKFVRRLIGGIGIGIASAVAGVSGSAIAVIFKIYEEIVWAFNNLFKRFKDAIKVVFPVMLGAMCGLIPCFFIFDKALEFFMFGLFSVFAGFSLGSLPGIVDEVRDYKITKKKWYYVLLIALGALLIITVGILSIVIDANWMMFFETPMENWWIFLLLIPIGFVSSSAFTIPGVSGALILLALGFYEPLINSGVTWLKEMFQGNFTNILPFILMVTSFAFGCMIGVFVFFKIIGVMLKKCRAELYYAVIGFIAGSIIVLYLNVGIWNYYSLWATNTQPGLPQWAEMLISFALLIGSAFGSHQLVKVQRKHLNK